MVILFKIEFNGLPRLLSQLLPCSASKLPPQQLGQICCYYISESKNRLRCLQVSHSAFQKFCEIERGMDSQRPRVFSSLLSQVCFRVLI